jgi:hypothetical protein
MTRHIVLAGLLVAAGAATLAGCSSGGGNSDESRIRSRYSQLSGAVERESIGDVMAVFSPNFLDDGYNYVDFRNSFAETFDMLDDISDVYDIHDIRVTGNFATADVSEHLEGNNVFKPGAPREYSDLDYTDIWHYEAGGWYLYGNQQSGTTGARKALRYGPERMKNALPVKK